MALILRNGGSQSPDRWLREPRNNQRGYQIVKSAINEAKELGGFGERRIALENLLDILSEVGLFLSIEQINIADYSGSVVKTKI